MEKTGNTTTDKAENSKSKQDSDKRVHTDNKLFIHKI